MNNSLLLGVVWTPKWGWAYMEDNSQFGAWWPEVDRTIRGMLHGRRATPADIDDIVQLTAERALTAKVSLTTEKAFGRWCTTVAKNLFVDEYRRANRFQRAAMPEQVDFWNPEEVVVSTQMRAHAERLLDQLTDRERWAFSWEGPRPEDPHERNQFNVALHRAVKRLEQGYSDLAIVLVCNFARLRGRMRGSGPAPAIAAAGVAVAVAALLNVETTRGPTSAGGRSHVTSSGSSRNLIPSKVSDTHVTTVTVPDMSARSSGTSTVPRRSPVPHVIVALPPYDGERHDVVIRPSGESDEGHLFCGGQTLVTPFFCISSPPDAEDLLAHGP